MKRSTLLTISISAAFAILLNHATAETSYAQSSKNCDSRSKVVKHLKEKWQEIPVSSGITTNGFFVEILSSPGSETWTMVITNPVTKRTCVIGSGEGWKNLENFPIEKSF
jgi:hypothetical protein